MAVNQSILLTETASLSPSPNLRSEAASREMASQLCATSSSLSMFRSVERPLGSPINPVAPPTWAKWE